MGKIEYNFGFLSEDKATEFLKKSGFEILERNFHSKFGEIDIIAKKDEILHFFEVKSTSKNYETIYRINNSKIKKILKTIDFYMLKNKISFDYQLDAVLLQNGNIEIVENLTL